MQLLEMLATPQALPAGVALVLIGDWIISRTHQRRIEQRLDRHETRHVETEAQWADAFEREGFRPPDGVSRTAARVASHPAISSSGKKR